MGAQAVSETKPTSTSIDSLRAAIPKHCFQKSTSTSMSYIVRDIALVCTVFYMGTQIQYAPSFALRCALWALYSVFQGFVFVGIWILAHECGHQAMFDNGTANDTFGLIMHSFLGVPYFSWKYSHARHHRFTNHMEKDTAFVPAKKDDGIHLMAKVQDTVKEIFHMTEDAPIVSLIFLVGHQLIGWQTYMLFYASSGYKSLANFKDPRTTSNLSHYSPFSPIYLPSQRLAILVSDLGLLAVGYGLYYATQVMGLTQVALLYGLPYLWVNHWLVAITYLHHNHGDAEHFEQGTWTFEKGALATVDRDFGFVGRELFHGIIEFHVVHHLFPRIPFYHAEEATGAIQPMLGKRYIRDNTSFLKALWKAWTSHHFVVEHETKPGVLVWAK
ncbi:hypothetical protein E4T49_03246 [Aureobasidium sp. EXF-10728]|nr:hypothetical protein E4T49_03246 [Aureobasidium sp. EXF-10728]